MGSINIIPITVAAGKWLTVSNTLTLLGTDASSVQLGAGGTVLYSGGALGTPSSGDLSNCTGFPAASVSGRLPFANLTAATAASRLLGRTSASAGDFQEITLGSGLALTGTVLDVAAAGGVTSITGTANQVIASGPTGAVTLSLPQSIAAASSPTFTGLTLTGNLTVTNIGRGSGAFEYGIDFRPITGVTVRKTGIFQDATPSVGVTKLVIRNGAVITPNGTSALTEWQDVAAGVLVAVYPNGQMDITSSMNALAGVNGAYVAGFGLKSGEVDGFSLRSASLLNWSSTTHYYGTKDTGIGRNAAGVLEVNNGTAGTFKAILTNQHYFNGTTSSFPMLKNSTTILQGRLADDSAFCTLQGILKTDANATTGLTAGVLAALTNATITVTDASGQVYRIPCII